MASVVEICNRALTKLGQGEQYISTLTDSTKEARVLNRVYADIRDLVLREHDWKCCIKRTQLNPMPGKVNKVVYLSTHDKFVAVGDNGLILTSVGGTVWDVQKSGVITDLNDICLFGTSTYTLVAVGDNGVILTSSDGITWTSRTSGTTRNIYGVGANGATLLVACGAAGLILSSADYITWTSRTSGKSVNLRGVAVNTTGPVYVCVGDHQACVSSSNGTTWTSRTPGVSGDDTDIYSVTMGGTYFVACGDDGWVSISADGASWLALVAFTSENMRGSSYANSVHFVVGESGTIYSVSDPSATWASRTSGVTDTLKSLVYSTSDEIYIAMGDCVLISSSNYITWTETAFTPAAGYDYQYLLPIDFLKMLGTNTDGSDADDSNLDWQIEGDYLLSDEEAVYARYIAQITDTTRWSIHLTEAVAVRIALEIAIEITGSGSEKQRLWQEYGIACQKGAAMEYKNGFVQDVAPIKWTRAGR